VPKAPLIPRHQIRSRRSGAIGWHCRAGTGRAPSHRTAQGDDAMSLGTILIIVLVIALLGGFSGRFGGYGYGYGNGGVGVIGTILIIVVVLMLMLMGRI
jgi:Protein of unknown function (DUF3309)